MTATAPEFSRPLTVDRIPRGGSYEKIAAEPAECAALARRLDLPALHNLNAEMRATPWRGGGLKLEGFLKADLEQVSVVSLEAFRHQVEFKLLRYFMPPGTEPDEDGTDIDFIEAGHVDLGEVVAETLALELDPYPRRPGEDFAGAGEPASESPAETSPFAALSRIKPK